MVCTRKCKDCKCQARQAEEAAPRSERKGDNCVSVDGPESGSESAVAAHDSDPLDADGPAPGILAAAKGARHRWFELVDAFKKRQPGSQRCFAVQALCRAGQCSAVRLLWFKVTKIESHIVGGVAVGDGKHIVAQVADVIDWMYLDSRDQKIKGLFTEDAVERQANRSWLLSEAG